MRSSMILVSCLPCRGGMCPFSLHFLSYIPTLLNIKMKPLCQAGLAVGVPLDPPRLPWSVYAYKLDGFIGSLWCAATPMPWGTLS